MKSAPVDIIPLKAAEMDGTRAVCLFVGGTCHASAVHGTWCWEFTGHVPRFSQLCLMAMLGSLGESEAHSGFRGGVRHLSPQHTRGWDYQAIVVYRC